MLKNFITNLHKSTKRKYLARMMDNKVACMKDPKNMEKIIGMEIEDMVMGVIGTFQVDGLK